MGGVEGGQQTCVLQVGMHGDEGLAEVLGGLQVLEDAGEEGAPAVALSVAPPGTAASRAAEGLVGFVEDDDLARGGEGEGGEGGGGRVEGGGGDGGWGSLYQTEME